MSQIIPVPFLCSICMMVIQVLAITDYDPKFKMAARPKHGINHSNDFFSRTTGPIWLIFYRKDMEHLLIESSSDLFGRIIN